ncbi:hypothetical protein [Actinomadura rugatobispora]|uniref:Uncharacterized protein n=1 Tax=Actinomadura rugatobispora TaxID=1994 RepID=A0ABW1A1H9_9ACTN|nr:hypothetical protein GCM10010200_049660 [Actinomadura rugatobispora]
MSKPVAECGALWTRILPPGAAAPIEYPTPHGSVAAVLAERLAGAGVPAGPLAIVVPDRWLDGDRRGVVQHESFRQELAPFPDLTWYGRSPAVAALAARDHGAGVYLVCDLGWSGASLGLCRVDGPMIELLAGEFEPRAGGGAYAQAVTAGLPDQVRRRFAGVQAAKAARARAVLSRASDGYLDDPVYIIDGVEFSAGLLIERFGPLAELLGERIRSLGWSYDRLVVSGGFGEFPLVERALPGPALRLGPDASVRGAELLERGTFAMARPGRVDVRLPVHRVANGLLETAEVELVPGPGNFAFLGREPLLVSRAGDGPGIVLRAADGRVPLTVGGAPGTIPVRNDVACRIGLRSTVNGSALLLFSPLIADAEPTLVPLDDWEPA